MKLDRKMIALIIVFLCVLAVIVAIPDVFTENSGYDESLSEARDYYKKNLNLLAIDSYNKAISEKESYEVELELCDAYFNGVKNGEITHLYDLSNYLTNLIDKYHNKPEIYDKAIKFYLENEDYDSAINVLDAADENRIDTETIKKAKKELKTKYKIQYAVIVDVKRSAQGTFVVKDATDYYVYDEEFKQVFEDKFDYSSSYINGYALAKQGKYTFLINSEGVRQAYFDNKIKSSTGVGSNMLACEINSKYSYYNLQGKKLFGDYKFAGRFKDDVAAVETDKGWQVINTKGKPVNNEFFEDIKLGGSDECCSGGVIFAKKSGKYYMYDSSLTKISDASFDDCDVFLDNTWLAAVNYGGKWGFIDSKGKTVINAKYDTAKSFSNGLAAVTIGNECYFIDKNEAKIITGSFVEGSYFNENGLCLVRNDTYWTPINKYYVEK